jgi:RNase P subunit RPR2
MNNYKTIRHKFQLLPDVPAREINVFRFAGMRLYCDECAAPLWLYGENFIESYSNGYADTLRCLCDMHAEEFGFVEVSR